MNITGINIWRFCANQCTEWIAAIAEVTGIAINIVFQAGTADECAIVDAGYTARDRNTGQTPTITERKSTNLGNTFRDGDTRKIFTAAERIRRNKFRIFMNIAGSNRVLCFNQHHERIVAVTEIIGIVNNIVFQAIAFIKCAPANAGYTIRYGNVGQFGAAGECAVTNTGNTIRDFDTCQVDAIIEQTIANAGNTVRNNDAGQVITFFKSRPAYVGDAVRDGYT